ncbi:MAG TPA: YihY/virulence factor BrkB family protein [Thermoanaerobaculia bacterium]|jgi:membrane protein|nr:YihY/virulence factor BrkB family protein [Thermoanaerobaculia bacterium]
MSLKPALDMLKESFNEWKEDDALQLGAALAYYTIFSIAPLLLIVIAVAGLVWGREAAQGQIYHQFDNLLGAEGAAALQTMVGNAAKQGDKTGILATVIAGITVLFGATGVFAQLQSALNKIWNVEPRPKSGIMGFIMTRVVSFGMILGIGFLLLVSLVVSAGMAAVDTYMSGMIPGSESVFQVIHFVIAFGVVTLLFAMIYRFLPDVKIAWRDVWIGAAITALLFTIGKFAIGLYLGHSSAASVFGAAGSLILVLLWIYYSTQILFFGAEITQVYARRYGSNIVPDENAVQVREVKEVVERAGPPEGGPERPSRHEPRRVRS